MIQTIYKRAGYLVGILCCLITLLLALLLPVPHSSAQNSVITLTMSKQCNLTSVGSAQLSQGGGYWYWIEKSTRWGCPINIPAAGQYVVSFYASTRWTPITIHLEDPPGTAIGTITLAADPATMNDFKLDSGTVTLPAGSSTLLLVPDSGGMYIADTVTLTPAGPPPPFVWPLKGFGTFSFPMQLPPDCSDGSCSINACNSTTGQCVTLLPGQSGNIVISRPTGVVTVVTVGP